MPTRASTTEADFLKDAKHVATMLDQHIQVFIEYEKPRTRKVITEAFLAGFKVDVADLERALKGQKVTRIVTTTATGEEEAAREAVYELLVQFRKDVNATPTASAALQAAAGVGVVFNPDSTQSLLSGAGTLLTWADVKQNKVALGEAGINDKKLAELRTADKTLAEADTQQGAKQRTSTTQTVTKSQLLAVVKKKITQVRSSADAASTKALNLVDIFKSVAPRHTPTPRPRKTGSEPGDAANAAAAGGTKATGKSK